MTITVRSYRLVMTSIALCDGVAIQTTMQSDIAKEKNEMPKVELRVTIIAHQVNDDPSAAAKKQRLVKVLSREMLFPEPNEHLNDFTNRIAGYMCTEQKRLEESIAKVASMQDRMGALAMELESNGYKDVARQLRRQAENITPSNMEDDIDDDDD